MACPYDLTIAILHNISHADNSAIADSYRQTISVISNNIRMEDILQTLKKSLSSLTVFYFPTPTSCRFDMFYFSCIFQSVDNIPDRFHWYHTNFSLSLSHSTQPPVFFDPSRLISSICCRIFVYSVTVRREAFVHSTNSLLVIAGRDAISNVIS